MARFPNSWPDLALGADRVGFGAFLYEGGEAFFEAEQHNKILPAPALQTNRPLVPFLASREEFLRFRLYVGGPRSQKSERAGLEEFDESEADPTPGVRFDSLD